MTESIVSIKYRITGVDEFSEMDGYVAVYLEPVKRIRKPSKGNPRINIHGVGPKGSPVPREVLQQLSMMLEASIPPEFKQSSEDPRNLIHVEPIVDFTPRNWKFGDIVKVSMVKVKDANEIDPVLLEKRDDVDVVEDDGR